MEQVTKKINEKREQLKALSNQLKPLLLLARQQEETLSLNELIIQYYQKEFGITELHTFEEWREKGYSVKRGEHSYLIWGKPRSRQEGENTEGEPNVSSTTDSNNTKNSSFFPVCYLFDIKQVHATKKETKEEENHGDN